MMFSVSISMAQNQEYLVAWWPFDDAKSLADPAYSDEHSDLVEERISGGEYRIYGLAKYVPGVLGYALKFDGFSSYLEGKPESMGHRQNEDGEKSFEFPREISVEAWVSLGAYPWNWAPILTVGKYKITGFYFGIDSRGRVGFHMSDATSVWHECNSNLLPGKKWGMELKKWYHVVGTYSPKAGLAIYVNGQLNQRYNDFEFDYGIVYGRIRDGFRMGMNREWLAPTDPIRDWATYPSRYSLDGIVDELKIYKKALTAGEVENLYKSIEPQNQPVFSERHFPAVRSSGRFAADYTRLAFYPEWDAIWPVGDYMDVVVQFDNLPVKVMFWRGTRYSPCWVSENGKWMADQSRETGNNWFLSEGPREEIPTGCIEHMSDTQCRSSRVAIIEDNEARKVINWRYLQMDVKLRQKDLPNNTGFGEWGNEVYYIYPDGVAVRKVLPGRGGWQETILLNEPGTRPEDNIELAACTLLNMNGESKTYSWADGYPVFDLPEANIQYIHFKSEYKPFLIFREGGGFEVFNLEVRPEYSHFPWWNHWPVAQIVSDGRSAFAPDRSAHSSLSWGDPNGEAALYGMTNKDPQTLVALARSWNHPADLIISGTDWRTDGYDYTQRAYIVHAGTNSKPEILEIQLQGSPATPLLNPAFVIKNWSTDKLEISLDKKSLQEGRDFRYGIEYDLNSRPQVIIWINMQSEKSEKIILSSHTTG